MASKYPWKRCHPRLYGETRATMNAAVNKYFENEVTLDRDESTNTKHDVSQIVDQIMDYINEHDPIFVKELLPVGSASQGLKAGTADEFDFSVVLNINKDCLTFSKSERYYKVNKERNQSRKTLPEDLNVVKSRRPIKTPPAGYYFISSTRQKLKLAGWDNIEDITITGPRKDEIDIVPILVQKVLKKLLKEAINELSLKNIISISPIVSGPALTLKMHIGDNEEIFVDLAPMIQSRSDFPGWIGWPRADCSWPGKRKTRKIQEFGFNFVAKRDLMWMISFAEVEKILVSNVDGDQRKRLQWMGNAKDLSINDKTKTCGQSSIKRNNSCNKEESSLKKRKTIDDEKRSVKERKNHQTGGSAVNKLSQRKLIATKRKPLHRVMKLLNENHWSGAEHTISSYILKNIWMYEMESHPDNVSWDNDHVWTRLYSMVRKLEFHIRHRHLSQYFFPDINLLDISMKPNEEKIKLTKKYDHTEKRIAKFLKNPLKYLNVND